MKKTTLWKVHIGLKTAAGFDERISTVGVMGSSQPHIHSQGYSFWLMICLYFLE